MNIKIRRILDFFDGHIVAIIFLCSLFLYLSFGLILTYSNDVVTKTLLDLIYSFDIGARYIVMYVEHIESILPTAHPFVQIIAQPYICFLQALSMSPKFNAVLAQSILTSGACCLFFNCLRNINLSKNASILFTVIFALSYSNLIIAAFPETHIYSGFMQVLLLNYLIILLYKNKADKLSFTSVLIIAILNTLSFGINYVNIVTSLIITVYILFDIYKFNFKKIVVNFLKIVLVMAALMSVFTPLQKNAFHDRKTFMQAFTIDFKNKKINNGFRFITIEKNYKKRLVYALQGTIVAPFYSLKSEPSKREYIVHGYKHYFGDRVSKRWIFATPDNLSYIPVILLFFVPLFYLIWKRQWPSDRKLLSLLFLIVITHVVLNSFWHLSACFLFSQNFLCYLILFIALLYKKIYEKLACFILFLFILYQIVVNYITIKNMSYFIQQIDNRICYPMHWVLYAALVTIFFIIIYFAVNKIISKEVFEYSEEKKYLIFTIAYVVYMIIFAAMLILFQAKI